MRKCNPLKVISVILFLVIQSASFAEVKNWTLGTCAFRLSSGEEDSFASAVSKMIPEHIADNLSSSMFRVISADEEYERKVYKLKADRISLFLQLESAVKSRDNLVLQNYSDKALKQKLKTESQKITEIEKKLEDNLKAFEDARKEADKKAGLVLDKKEKSELRKYIELFKGFVTAKDETPDSEKVVLYKSGESSLYNEGSSFDGNYESQAFEKQVVNAKIDALITGNLKIIGDYLAVTSEIILYPGHRKAGTVTEIGSVNDIDGISQSLARSLAPLISSSMPVSLRVNVTPKEALETLSFSIDDVVYKEIEPEYVVDSGVHQIRFDAEGYKTAVTSYFFDGNGIYNIEVELQEKSSGNFFVKLKNPMDGKFYVNGEFEGMVTEEAPVARIRINDSDILGQFIDSEGKGGIFYVPKKIQIPETTLKVNAKTFDRSKYIETRRKWMYSAYSVFLVSFIAAIFTEGNYYTTAQAVNSYPTASRDLYDEAKAWQVASQVCTGITLASGLLWGYELVRYFMAADTVLPATAKKSSYEVSGMVYEKKPEEISEENTEISSETAEE